MDTLSIIMLVTSVLTVVLSIYLERRKKAKASQLVYKKSIEAIEPILTDTQANKGDRKYEEEYVDNGRYILENGSFLKIINELELNVQDNDND